MRTLKNQYKNYIIYYLNHNACLKVLSDRHFSLSYCFTESIGRLKSYLFLKIETPYNGTFTSPILFPIVHHRKPDSLFLLKLFCIDFHFNRNHGLLALHGGSLKVFGYYFRQASHFFQRKSVGRLHFFVGKNVLSGAQAIYGSFKSDFMQVTACKNPVFHLNTFKIHPKTKPEPLWFGLLIEKRVG